MRRRLTYANVASTIALVLAMSGGAFAAGHYLINSTKQINPKVLHKLHGARGARGVAGPSGAVGPQGIEGREGRRGSSGPPGEPGFSALAQLPTGRTESGDFAVSTNAATAGETVQTAITFSIPLSIPFTAERVEFTTAKTSAEHCTVPGTASRGFVCIYTSSETNVVKGEGGAPQGTSTAPEIEPPVLGTGRFGAVLGWKALAPGPVNVIGTYTITAP
jgi:Collagen triple helix repeat (20 copies)